MRLVILSDIHANLEALQAVLAEQERRVPEPKRLVCLGDIVGYGADPEAVTELVRRSGMDCVMGNHELGVSDPGARRRFNPQAWGAVRWARSRLSAESLAWLAGLPTFLSLSGCRFVHGMPPDEVDTYLAQVSDEAARRAMLTIPEPVCFVGHTHNLRLVGLVRGELVKSRLDEGRHRLDPGGRFLVNAGAVGQPRDGDSRAKYLVYDPVGRELDVRYVPYDARAAAEKILTLCQPRAYAERLCSLDDEPEAARS